jgi:molybdate transport system ATP-binding protein
MHFQFLEILAGYTTAVLVTHSRDEAYKLCPEILVMDAGKPLCAGSREEVFANPGTVTAARLTGCKNISPARRTGAHELYAADWELPLRLPQIVPPGITHVGIRAHDIEEAERNFSAGPNYLRPALTRYGDELFETVFLFTNAGAPSSKEIWWKVKRGAPFPALFYFPPEKLLLLRE